MINSRKKPVQDGYPEDCSQGYTDEQVDAMNADMEDQLVLQRVNVELLTDHIQEQLRDFMDGLYFEPNDDLTRRQLRRDMTEFLEDLKDGHHIDEYCVVCDSTNNTSTNINNGELHVDVMIIPQGSQVSRSVGGVSYKKPRLISAATGPVGQITMDEDDDAIVVSTGFYGAGTVSISAGSAGSTTLVSSSNITTKSNINLGGSIAGAYTLDLAVSQVAELPGITFNGYDYDEKRVTMILQPESTISTLEAFKITLLINAATHSPRAFSVYAYIKKNNLERHFKFTQ